MQVCSLWVWASELMHWFKTGDGMLGSPPQISPPPLLPAPPFPSPVEVEGELYIAQERVGTANKQMLEMMRL